MSVLIKGLNIEPCDDGFDGRGLVIIGYDDKLYAVAHEQIISLPDHGDLIERDPLMTGLGMAMDCEGCPNRTQLHFCGLSTEMMEVCDKLENAPVVIPAERSEDDPHN